MSLVSPLRPPLVDPLGRPLRAGSGLPWEGGVGGGPAPTVVGLKFASTSDYVLGAANWSETILYVQTRILPNSVVETDAGTGAERFFCGCSNGAGPHVFLGGAISGAGLARNRLAAFATVYGDPAPVGQEPVITNEIVSRGRYLTLGMRLDPGVALELWLDGKLVWRQTVGSIPSTLGAAAVYAINRRVSAAALGYGAFTWVETMASTSVLSDAQVRAAQIAPPGTPLPSGLVHDIRASDLGVAGGTVPASFVDRVGGSTYNITRPTASLVAVPFGNEGLGTVEIIADSKWAGREPGGLLNVGPRRYFEKSLHVSRTGVLVGQFSYTWTPTGPMPVDTDFWHTGVGGMGLGRTPGAGTTRLSTVTVDRAHIRGARPTGITGIVMGLNDLYRDCFELAASSATAVSNLNTAFDSEVSGLRVARSGPIVIHTIARVSSSVGNANYRAAVSLFNSGAAALVATLNATYGNVYLFDEEAALIAYFGAAYYDDAAFTWDGTHYTDLANQVVGAAAADFYTRLA